MKCRHTGNGLECSQCARFMPRQAIGEGAQPPPSAAYVALYEKYHLRVDPPFNPVHGAEQIGFELHQSDDGEVRGSDPDCR